MNNNSITPFPKTAIERLAFPINRKAIEATIEMLVDLLNTLEPDADDEPTLGAPERDSKKFGGVDFMTEQVAWADGDPADGEGEENADLEVNGDDEYWLAGAPSDLEADPADLESPDIIYGGNRSEEQHGVGYRK